MRVQRPILLPAMPRPTPAVAAIDQDPSDRTLVRHGGVLKIEINGEVFEPLAYPSYRPRPS